MQIKIYETRLQFIEPYVAEKKVLDVGPAELVGTVNREKMARWPHNFIAQHAKQLVGLEKNAEQVQALSALGFNIVQGNAEQFSLDDRFDVVFAGEVIEHLSNPGAFLACALAHLKPNGDLLLTTPNRFSVQPLLSIFRHNHVPEYNKPIDGHVLYFDLPGLSELLARYGFVVAELGYYVSVGAPVKGKQRLLYRVLKKYRPHLLPGIVVAAKKSGG